MLVPNRVSGVLTPEQVKVIMEHLQAIRDALPFLISLTKDERQRLPKIGDAHKAFARQAADVGKQFSGILPRDLDMDEVQKDVALMDALHPIKLVLQELTEKVVDTDRQSSNEVYQAGLLIYRSAKNTKSSEGLRQATRDLGRRFARSARTRDDEGQDGDGSEPAAQKPPRKGKAGKKATKNEQSEQSE